MSRAGALTLVMLVAVLNACDAHGSSASQPALKSTLVDDGPVVNWDHPFIAEGVTVAPETLLGDPAAFGVTFKVTIPKFPFGKLRWIDVSSHATVAFMFDFGGDPRFSSDSRAQVEEFAATMTQDELLSVARPGTYAMPTVGSTTILVLESKGVGDATFIQNGILYDIAGPALTAEAARDLAQQLVTQL